MNRSRIWGCSLGLCAMAMGLAGDDTLTRSPQGESSLESNSIECAHADHAVPGRKAFVDPATGRIVPRPVAPAEALPPQAQDALSTSGEGLREVPGKTRSGGMKVHLQGRFRSHVSASIDSTGRLSTHCQTEASSSTR